MAAQQKLVLLTGSDLGNRAEYLNSAKRSVQQLIGTVIKESTVHETEPWGFTSDTKFLNQALLVETDLTPLQVLAMIHRIETELGRERISERWSSRIIDIDILCWESLLLNTEELRIPHQQLHQREFALIPLCEVVPDWIHPEFGISYRQILQKDLITPI